MDVQERERIAVEVFKRTGIGLSADDPVFVVAELCKEVFSSDTELYIEKQRAVLKAIREIPSAISEAVDIVANAVDRAENITAELVEASVEKAKKQATSVITEALEVHLSSANEGLAELERRVKLASSSLRDPQSFRLNLLLGGALLFFALTLPLSIFVQQKALATSQQEAAYYLRSIDALETSINQLPPALKEKVLQSAKP